MASRRCLVNLFCEDLGHEQFTRALLERIAAEESVPVAVVARSARGGIARAVGELEAFQAAVGAGLATEVDLLVVVIDANAQGWHKRRSEIRDAMDSAIFPSVAIGCPDPHIEAWCFADRDAVQAVTHKPCPALPTNPSRGAFKTLLRSTLDAAGLPVLGDAMDYAGDFVTAMDFYRAESSQPSLRDFCGELRNALRQFARSQASS